MQMWKNLQEIRKKPIVQLWKQYYQSSKHEAGQSVRRDERFLSLAQIDKLYHELK